MCLLITFLMLPFLRAVYNIFPVLSLLHFSPASAFSLWSIQLALSFQHEGSLNAILWFFFSMIFFLPVSSGRTSNDCARFSSLISSQKDLFRSSWQGEQLGLLGNHLCTFISPFSPTPEYVPLQQMQFISSQLWNRSKKWVLEWGEDRIDAFISKSVLSSSMTTY